MMLPGGLSGTVAPASVALPQLPAQPVPRVLRRPMAPSNEQERDVARVKTGRRPRPEQRWSGAPALVPEPGDMSAGEVNRLTDRVIQAIDRRIIAERERLGRI
jgi:hypothetical protein